MTRKDIIRMAREAGVLKMVGGHLGWQEFTERFATLVAAAERESCANSAWDIVQYEVNADLADKVVQAIQSRSKL